MKVNIITVAYNMPAATRQLVETASLDANKHDIRFQIFTHSKHPDTLQTCYDLAAEYPIHLFDHQANRGLSTSWNDGLVNAYVTGDADVVIVANDDIYFTAGDIDKLATKAYQNRDSYIISCAGNHLGYRKNLPTHGYSCFALNPITLDKIGYFDENFFPIYLEDIDHHRRATLAGLVEENCADTMVYHGGSSAINNSSKLARQNIQTHRLNILYYQIKWGGPDSGGETYKHPFNDPGFGLKIEMENRHHPYGPDHDRDDQYIVEI